MIPNIVGNKEKRSCGAKKRYINEREAKRAVKAIRRNTGDETHAYFCDFCHYWHVGRTGMERCKTE